VATSTTPVCGTPSEAWKALTAATVAGEYTPSIGPFVYRAVYTDPANGVPYASLLHDSLESSPDLSTEARVWCGKC